MKNLSNTAVFDRCDFGPNASETT